MASRFIRTRSVVLLISAFLSANAACPNACSENGICGASDKCSCYSGFQGADCSLRTCPFTLAWADTADGTNQAHYYAECGNKGICDRATGECACFEGFEGKGCMRSVCPNNCNGRGTCEYMEEMAKDWQDRKSGPGMKFKDMSCNTAATSAKNSHTANDFTNCHSHGLVTTNVVARSANRDTISGILYQEWDARKIQVCKCDIGFDGVDCGDRMVPKGDDKLTPVQSTGMKQAIALTSDLDGEFIITYLDPYGGSWNTDAIRMEGIAGNVASDDDLIAKRVKEALRALPNQVLDAVDVYATTLTSQKFCTRYEDGVQHFLPQPQHNMNWRGKKSKGQPNYCEAEYTNTGMWDPAVGKIDVTIQFGTTMGQSGVQYLMEVDPDVRSSGSSPVSKGVTYTQFSIAEINYNDNLQNLSELSDCSDRGLDNGDGECECFEGFQGGACETLEAVV